MALGVLVNACVVHSVWRAASRLVEGVQARLDAIKSTNNVAAQASSTGIAGMLEANASDPRASFRDFSRQQSEGAEGPVSSSDSSSVVVAHADAALASLEAEHAAEVASLRASHEVALSEAVARATGAATAAATAEATAAAEAHAAALAQLRDEHASAAVALSASHAAELQRLRESHVQELESTAHADAVRASLEAEHAAEVASLRASHEAALSEAVSHATGAATAAATAEATAAATAEATAAAKTHAAALTELNCIAVSVGGTTYNAPESSTASDETVRARSVVGKPDALVTADVSAVTTDVPSMVHTGARGEGSLARLPAASNPAGVQPTRGGESAGGEIAESHACAAAVVPSPVLASPSHGSSECASPPAASLTVMQKEQKKHAGKGSPQALPTSAPASADPASPTQGRTTDSDVPAAVIALHGVSASVESVRASAPDTEGIDISATEWQTADRDHESSTTAASPGASGSRTQSGQMKCFGVSADSGTFEALLEAGTVGVIPSQGSRAECTLSSATSAGPNSVSTPAEGLPVCASSHVVTHVCSTVTESVGGYDSSDACAAPPAASCSALSNQAKYVSESSGGEIGDASLSVPLDGTGDIADNIADIGCVVRMSMESFSTEAVGQ